ncbi:MAG: S9 family peptidase [Dehalococcoidia bacterium]|nr:S9 family peptidase [Dehalococcoidia bacterium]
MKDRPIPPVAEKRPHSFTHHGITIEDPWHWLRDPNYPKVDDADILAYLTAENDYFKAVMSPHKSLSEAIFEEIKGREQPDRSSVPFKDDDWYYQWRYEEGSQYRVWLRWPADGANAREAPTSDVQTILSEPELAKDSEYFMLGSLSMSNSGSLLAYSTDINGSERFTMVIKDLETGEMLPDQIEETAGNAVWASDDSSFLYTVVDENWRPWQVRLHVLGDPVENDAVVYEETDPGFFIGVGPSSSKQYVIIGAGDHITSEVRLLRSSDLGGEQVLVSPRRSGHEYSIDHQGDRFVVRTNDTHKNTRLATAPEDDPTERSWSTLVYASDTHYIRGFATFQDFIAVHERIEGLDHIRLIDRAGDSTYIRFPESAYSAHIGNNEEFQTNELRLQYSSMVTPDTVYDYHRDTGELEVRKVREIPSGYDASKYVTERTFAEARDGEWVPASVVRRRDTPEDGTAPLYLYGYGAYGIAIPPSFSTTYLSLLDRGFIVVIAHIRGGDDLGYHWYEAGKLDRRTNTFNDFVDVAHHLIEEGYTSQGRITIAGGSAGGELVGAALNLAPDLWGAVAAHVPFVDVLNTILDDTLPLTPIEWPEWGNPIEDKAAFEYIRSYSPYDQLESRDYPPILVTAGLNDPRVTYWEPAKFVAKLRTLKTDDNPLLLKTNMGAGHGGRSGRYEQMYEDAEEYAFILTSMRLVE